MFIVHALNRQHMVWAAVSGAKFVLAALSVHSRDICDLLLVDSLRSLLTTGLCVSQTAKSSQLYAIRLQNAGDVHDPLQSTRWWRYANLTLIISWGVMERDLQGS